MTFDQFCTAHRLRATKDVCGDYYVVGRSGWINGNVGDRLVLTIANGPSAARWNAARRKGLALGMELWQDGDDEGSMLFDPTDSRHAKLAIRLARCRVRRIATPAQRAVLARHAFGSKTARASGPALTLEPSNAPRTHQEPALEGVA